MLNIFTQNRKLLLQKYLKFIPHNWGQEEKGTTEEDMAGWHHRLDGREFEWTPGVGDGQGGLACCDSWGCKESYMTEWLNWTEQKKKRGKKCLLWKNYCRSQMWKCLLEYSRLAQGIEHKQFINNCIWLKFQSFNLFSSFECLHC